MAAAIAIACELSGVLGTIILTRGIIEIDIGSSCARDDNGEAGFEPAHNEPAFLITLQCLY